MSGCTIFFNEWRKGDRVKNPIANKNIVISYLSIDGFKSSIPLLSIDFLVYDKWPHLQEMFIEFSEKVAMNYLNMLTDEDYKKEGFSIKEKNNKILLSPNADMLERICSMTAQEISDCVQGVDLSRLMK